MNRNARPESDSNASILLAHFYEATHRMTAKLLLVAKRESVAMFDYNAPSKDGCVKLLRIDRLNERSSRSSSSYLYNPNGGGGGSQYSNSTKGMNGVDDDEREKITCMTWTGQQMKDWKFAEVQHGNNRRPNNTNTNSTTLMGKDEYIPDMFVGLSSGAILAIKLRKSFSDKRANTTRRMLHKIRYQTQTKDNCSASGNVHRTTCVKYHRTGRLLFPYTRVATCTFTIEV